MNAIIAVQDLIVQNQRRIKILKQQLRNHESGVIKLSPMSEASVELGLEKSQDVLEKNEIILKELQKKGLVEIEKEQSIKEAIIRRNYYKYQKVRLKRDLVMSNDQKLEAMMIIDELPHDINIEDKELFAIAETTINLNLRVHEELYDEMLIIQKDWNELLKTIDVENINKLGMVNMHIPILVLHLSVLINNIKENIEENDLPTFRGLPPFEDWWIEELWENHQAYFGLYKWRSIIASLCLSTEQKNAWSRIFASWIFIKKILNQKGKLGFEFNFAFDTLIEHHTHLSEEVEQENLISMEKIIKEITEKENFNDYKSEHSVETDYLEFKRKKINYGV